MPLPPPSPLLPLPLLPLLLLLLLLPGLSAGSGAHGHARRFNSPEHVRLGDALRTLPGAESLTLRLRNGLAFSFGELVALFGRSARHGRAGAGESERGGARGGR